MKRTNPFIAAVYFLTSIPVTKKRIPLKDLARGLWTFSFIGLFIGIILSFVCVVSYAVFPHLLSCALLLVTWVWITGALHLDGFIDCCDALLAPKSKEERLAILKDVSTGSFGVTGAVLLFIVKYSALLSIDPGALLIVLPLSAVTGRSVILYVMFRFPPAREEGLGKICKDNIKARDVIVSFSVLLFVAASCFFFCQPFYLGFIIIGTAIVFSELFGFWVLQRIPGFTGDVYGAACELAETITLVTAAVVLKVVT